MAMAGALTLVRTLYSQLSTCCWTGIVEAMLADAQQQKSRHEMLELEELQVNDGSAHDE